MYYARIEVGQLGCINLSGLSLGLEGRVDKLSRKLVDYHTKGNLSPNHGTGFIETRKNPLNGPEFLIIDGHHRSFSSYVFYEPVEVVVYENADEITDRAKQFDFWKSVGHHQTAMLTGKGMLKDLMTGDLFRQYIQKLKGIKNADPALCDVICVLERFLPRVH